MESGNSTYGPLVVHEKAYQFFPNSNPSITQKKSRRQKRERKELVSFILDRSNTMNTNAKK